ncbi:MAG TPA: AgmX/PglI C-terminal domain-containing protein [Polyangiaceae bacterium]|nr:AgmX/PglI C-terminal domain-containing protein [Polyangiaceae bacterium]
MAYTISSSSSVHASWPEASLIPAIWSAQDNRSQYILERSGPAPAPAEVELEHVTALEVIMLWGSQVLRVEHLNPPRNVSLGDRPLAANSAATRGTDFYMPSEALGRSSAEIVKVEGDQVHCSIFPGMRAFLEERGALREIELSHDLPVDVEQPEARRLSLRSGQRVTLKIADFSLQIAPVSAGKPVDRGLRAAWNGAAAGYFGLSLGVHAGLLAAFAFFAPPLGLSDADELDRDRLYVMQSYLDAAAERERLQEETPEVAAASKADGGTGSRSTGEEGSMGNPTSRATQRRYAVKGPRDNPDPTLAREQAVKEAAQFGVIGLLSAGLAGDPNSPTAIWGADHASGRDDLSARGNIWGEEIGEAFGAGGLSLTGVGEGAGGPGKGVGFGDVGTIGHGRGLGDGQGFGNSVGGPGSRGHVGRVPTMHPGVTSVSGRLPPEVIQRVVRQNFGRFRMCFNEGLRRNPNLEGRVAARFVIDRSGAVSAVSNGGSDLPDSAVVSCVLSAFYGLSFPEPQNGIVSVVYPISFAPG